MIDSLLIIKILVTIETLPSSFTSYRFLLACLCIWTFRLFVISS